MNFSGTGAVSPTYILSVDVALGTTDYISWSTSK